MSKIKSEKLSELLTCDLEERTEKVEIQVQQIRSGCGGAYYDVDSTVSSLRKHGATDIERRPGGRISATVNGRQLKSLVDSGNVSSINLN